MRRIVFMILIWSWSSTLKAQEDAVLFSLSNGQELSSELKAKIEHQVKNLLTAINVAESTHSEINYSGLDIDSLTSKSIDLSWRNLHFRTEDTDIMEHCICLGKHDNTLCGYQVRNIGMVMKLLNSANDKYLRQEINLNFSSTGRIVDFNFSMETQHYRRLLDIGVKLDDLYQRMQIIHWCEQFKKAAVDKDIEFVENLFNSNVYFTKGKHEFLSDLHQLFIHKDYIDMKFSDCQIVRHSTKSNFYELNLSYESSSSHYNSGGIIFLIWDFTHEDVPVIQIGTWQPLGKKVNRISEFKLP